MEFLRRFKDRAVIKRMEDEAFHEAAAREIASGRVRDGLWAKAMIASSGVEAKAKAEYLRLLVTALRDEAYVVERMRGADAHRVDGRVERPEGNEVAKAPTPPPPPALPESDSALMERFGIRFDGEYFHYKKYRYTKLEDAVNYAKLGRE